MCNYYYLNKQILRSCGELLPAMKHFTLLSTFFVGVFSWSQYCTVCGPSSNADSNVQSVQLTGSSGAINFTGCPGVIGLQDLTMSQSVGLTAGSSYTVSIQFGTCGGNYTGVGQAWIDFDQSGTFDPSESLGTWQGIPPTSLSSFNFTVPVNALSGSTRMRIVQYEGGALPINPCASFTWGSSMDFGITVSGGIDCSGYQGDILSDAIDVPSIPYSTSGNTGFCYFNQNLVYSSPDIYYRIVPGSSIAQLTVSLCGSGFDTFLSVVEPDGTVVAYNDDACGSASEVTFSTAGLDTVYAIIEGWGNESGNFTLNINAEYVALAEISGKPLTVFPNPSNEYVQISGVAESDIYVTDSRGNGVMQQKGYHGEPIPTTELAPGIYFIRVVHASQTAILQFSRQ